VPLDYSNSGLPQNKPGVAGNQKAAADSSIGSSSLMIEELSSPPGGQPRMVVLQGPGLPFMGAEWGFANALVTEWYPGNGDEATQQSLGPMELPSQWQGKWSRTMMGRAPSVYRDETGALAHLVDPFTLADYLEAMLRGGARLRVTWAQVSSLPSGRGRKVREGRCKECKFKYTRVEDIAWEIQFEWQSRGSRVQTVTSVRDAGLNATAARMSIAQQALTQQITSQSFIQSDPSIYKSATPLTLGQIDAFANAPATYVNSLLRQVQQTQSQLQAVANIALTLESQPLQIEQSVVNAARNAVAAAHQTIQQFGQVAFETQSQKSNVHDLLRSFRYFGQTSDATYAAALAAQDVVTQLALRAPTAAGGGSLGVQGAQSSGGDFIGVYSCKDGDTPARISYRFYGNMDHGQDILQANRLPWHQPTFNKGQVLLIPRLKTQQSRS
jgi:hypothetical protein